MGLGRIAAAAVLFLVLNATPAAAGAPLSTGTLQVGDGTGVTYVCLVTNLEKKDLTFSIRDNASGRTLVAATAP